MSLLLPLRSTRAPPRWPKAFPWMMNWTGTAQVREKQHNWCHVTLKVELVTHDWEKHLAEVHPASGNILRWSGRVSFVDSSDFHQKTEQLGNTGRTSMEKHKMRSTEITAQGQIYIWRCNETLVRKHFSLSFLHHPFPGVNMPERNYLSCSFLIYYSLSASQPFPHSWEATLRKYLCVY